MIDGDGVELATITELEAAGKRSTAIGQVAMVLARRIDADIDTGSSMAALVKELRVLLDAVTGKSEPDIVDELRARRDKRLGRTTPRGSA